MTQGVNKIDVIERHLVTAVQMIVIEASPISTHVLVKACEEMIFSVAEAKDVLLDSDYRIYIKDEHHEDFRRLNVKAYNFFKHADRDSNDLYDDIPLADLNKLNELLTMINIAGHFKISHANIPILTEYCVAQSIVHPHLFKLDFLDRGPPGFRRQHERLRSAHPDMWRKAILWSLHQKGLMPEVPPQYY